MARLWRSSTRSSTWLCLLGVILRLSVGLEVAPDSPCASKCIDAPNGDSSSQSASQTYSYNLGCHDWEYVGDNSTQVGHKFRDCNNCLKGSKYVDSKSKETDVQWFTLNNRATADWCLFGRFGAERDGNTTSSIQQQCRNDCNPIYNATDYRIRDDVANYTFCDTGGNFTADADKCLGCLRRQSGLTVLGNGKWIAAWEKV